MHNSYVIYAIGMRLIIMTTYSDGGFAARLFDVKPERDEKAVEISEGVFGRPSYDPFFEWEQRYFEYAFEQPDILDQIQKVNSQETGWIDIEKELMIELFQYRESGKEKALLDAFKQRNRLRMKLS